MASARLPNDKLLWELLDYNPETGELTWKQRDISFFSKVRFWRAWNAKYAGKPVESALHATGYYEVKVLGRRYKVHRIIWKMVHGKDPNDIDHINGNRADNRIVNLRSVNRIQNCQNMKRSKNNVTGVTGVHRHGQTGRWIAAITIKYQKYYLGIFPTFEEAVSARKAAEREHGFHENHGRAA